MSRYKVVGPWGGEKKYGSFHLQSADIEDTRTGRRYERGAYRVVKAPAMKPAKTGKGGTVPFFGEMAWCDGERLLDDLGLAEALNPRKGTE